MKNTNVFLALSTAVINSLVAVVFPHFGSPKLTPVALTIGGIISPFLAIYLLKVYIRADDPPELTRKISALRASISICKKDLKDKNASDDFKRKTRKQLENFQSKLQNVRSEFEADRSHVITPLNPPEP